MKRITIAGIFTALLLVSCNEKVNTTEPVQDEPTIEDESTVAGTEQQVINASEFKVLESSEVDQMNQVIANEKITELPAILHRFYPKDEQAEGHYNYQNSITEDPNSNITVIELIEEGINDDSVRAIKTVITLESIQETWKIIQVKQSFKCHVNRGQQDWSSSYCQ